MWHHSSHCFPFHFIAMSQQNEFIEIRKPREEELPRTITAFMMAIEPKDCSKLAKQLAKQLPLDGTLSHLKRVRNPHKMKGNNHETKKPKVMLQLLVGLDPSVSLAFPSAPSSTLATTATNLEPVVVPGRPPKSKKEWEEFNHLWPTTFLPLQSQEHREQLLALSEEEATEMQRIMEQHVLPNDQVVIVDPTAFTIVSTSKHEYELQSSIVDNNPLATPIILALQGVSRIERQAASTLPNESFAKGQYLCTGYDLYSPYEPTVFEAMSGLHHRLRRVVYFAGRQNKSSVWKNGLSRHCIHSLPGTNHRYRAFEYRISDGTRTQGING